jgi:hypothetical protein
VTAGHPAARQKVSPFFARERAEAGIANRVHALAEMCGEVLIGALLCQKKFD